VSRGFKTSSSCKPYPKLAVFNLKRAELLEQIDQFRASPEWAKIQSDGNFAMALPEDKTREARMERLKRDFKEYSELLYSTASARLRSVSELYH
jgi:hypothetical protein